MDKQTHKDLRKVPDDLLPALEEHLSEMDSIRKANASQPRYAVKVLVHILLLAEFISGGDTGALFIV